MPKIAEELRHEGIGTTYTLKQTYDAQPVIDDVQNIRRAKGKQSGEMRHVARIPAWLPKYLCSIHGVNYDDVHARKELLYRLLMNGELAKFRIDEGTHDMRF